MNSDNSDTLTLQLLQTRLVWEDAAANCRQLERALVDSVCGDVLLLPEMFNSGFSMRPDRVAETMDGPTVQWMGELAKARDQVVVGSLAIRENGSCFNRMIWMPPQGELTYYDKRHLFAMAGEHKCYRSGSERRRVYWRGWAISLQVCYDLRFPVWCRQDPQDPYDLMILVANWPAPRALAWNRLIPARAVENQAFVAALNRVGDDARGWNYSGDSQVVDDLGRQLLNLGERQQLGRATLNKRELKVRRENFPFQVDADRFHLDIC